VSVWLVSGNAHVFVPLSVVTVTLRTPASHFNVFSSPNVAASVNRRLYTHHVSFQCTRWSFTSSRHNKEYQQRLER